MRGAGDVPVTVKLRIGVDDAPHARSSTPGASPSDEGAAAVALHARTAEQHYSGRADWRAIAELRAALPDVPVLGNGDIWQAADALRMLRRDRLRRRGRRPGLPRAARGCSATSPGRSPGASRPRRAAAGRGHRRPARATLALLAEWLTEPVAVRDIRKHVGWYLQGYPVGGDVRRRLTGHVDGRRAGRGARRADRAALAALRVVDGCRRPPAGQDVGPDLGQRCPHGWLTGADDPTPVVAEELEAVSGG